MELSIYIIIKLHIQAVSQDRETSQLEVSVSQKIIASFTHEGSVGDLTRGILSALATAEDFDAANKYTFGVVSVLLDGRNKEGNPDMDPEYFALAVLDDFSDDQKDLLLQQEFPKLTKSQRVRKFDTTKLKRLHGLQNHKAEMLRNVCILTV